MDAEEALSPFAKVVDELEQFIVGQKVAEIELRQQLFAVQSETRLAQRALEVLQDRKANQERKTSPKDAQESPSAPKKPARRKPVKNEWIPSTGKMQAVLSAVTDKPQTAPQIALTAGVSTETARKALQHLRITDQVRMAGVMAAGNSNNKAKSYALMPVTAPEGSPNGA